MVADSLDNRSCAAVAYGETFACHAIDEHLPRCRPVQGHVAADDVAVRPEAGSGRLGDYDPSATHPLADIIVGLSDQPEGYSRSQERTEALSGRTLQRHIDGAVWQAGSTEALHDAAAEGSRDGPVGVVNQ